MSEEQSQTYDLVKIGQYALVAEQFLQNKNTIAAQKSLEAALADNGQHPVVQSLVAGAMQNPQTLEATLTNMKGRYSDEMNKKSVKDVLGEYSSDNEDLQKEYKKFADHSYGDLMKEIGKAQYMLKDQFGIVSDKDKEKSQKILNDYTIIMKILNESEQQKIESLAEPIRKDAYKTELEDLLKKKKAADDYAAQQREAA